MPPIPTRRNSAMARYDDYDPFARIYPDSLTGFC